MPGMLTRRSISLSIGVVVMTAGLATVLAIGTGSNSTAARLLADRDLRSVELARNDYPVWMELPRLSSVEAESAERLEGEPTSELLALDSEAAEQVVGTDQTSTGGASTSSPGGLVQPLRFNVTDFGMAASLDEGGKIRTSKPVMLAGNRLGTIELAVGQGASVSIDRKSMADLIGDKSPALASTLTRLAGDRVTLEELRSSDVAVRYDPLADVLVIEPRS